MKRFWKLLTSILVAAIPWVGSFAQPKVPVEVRIAQRSFPSVFQAWNPVDQFEMEDRRRVITRHDLLFGGPGQFGLAWASPYDGTATEFDPASLHKAESEYEFRHFLNPDMVFLLEIRYRDAPPGYLPPDSPWWKRDANGNIEKGWAEGGYQLLDYGNPDFRAQVAQQCAAAVNSGVLDGIMLDWWQDNDDQLALITAIRRRIGDKALILVNTNQRIAPRSTAYVNGYYMECTRDTTAQDWADTAATLTYADEHCALPHINCVENWWQHSRQDLNLMRATTTLVLTRSDGYCLFCDPDPLPTPDHLHNWYPFWDKSLGRPLGPGRLRPDGAYDREFQYGTALYNPLGNAPVTVTFDAPHASVATGVTASTFPVNPEDGDLFLNTSAAR